jgi:hypothetical protein
VGGPAASPAVGRRLPTRREDGGAAQEKPRLRPLEPTSRAVCITGPSPLRRNDFQPNVSELDVHRRPEVLCTSGLSAAAEM